MVQKAFQFGPVLTDRIISVVKRVDGTPYEAGVTRIQTRFEESSPYSPPLRRGTFTGAWAIGTTKAVEISGSTQTVSVTNYCTPVFSSTSYTSQMNVIFGSVAGTVSAVAVQSDVELRLGKTSASWVKDTTANITLWEDGTPPNMTQGGGVLGNCINKFATVAANKWVGLMRGPGGRHYLIAAEC